MSLMFSLSHDLDNQYIENCSEQWSGKLSVAKSLCGGKLYSYELRKLYSYGVTVTSWQFTVSKNQALIN